jgi:hypothetical protein
VKIGLEIVHMNEEETVNNANNSEEQFLTVSVSFLGRTGIAQHTKSDGIALLVRV